MDHKSGQQVVCTNIPILCDNDSENDESFRLRIIPSPANGNAYFIGTVNLATVTIKNENGEDFILKIHDCDLFLSFTHCTHAVSPCKERLVLLACKSMEMAGENLPASCITLLSDNNRCREYCQVSRL